MHKPTFGEKVRYYFENTMSAGPSGVIKCLPILSSLLVVTLGIVILMFGISSSAEPDAKGLGFIKGSRQILMSTIDPGTMGGDAPVWPYSYQQT